MKFSKLIRTGNILKKITILPLLMSIVFAAHGSLEDKTAATMKQMETIGSAIEAYMEDHQKAPEAFSIIELARLLEPMYINDCPLKDAWGNRLYYTARNTPLKKDGMISQYWIGSGANSGEFGGFLKYMTKLPSKGNDIVYTDGEFKSIPGPE
jgi:hypothetical protein